MVVVLYRGDWACCRVSVLTTPAADDTSLVTRRPSMRALFLVATGPSIVKIYWSVISNDSMPDSSRRTQNELEP